MKMERIAITSRDEYMSAIKDDNVYVIRIGDFGDFILEHIWNVSLDTIFYEENIIVRITKD